MPLIIDVKTQELLVLIQKAIKPGQHVYLVGGAVRDSLLGCQLNDLDFVLAENPLDLAKKISRQLNAGFFVLDDERQTVRIMYFLPSGQFFPLDFVKFSGKNLEVDLSNRDFTINAMAVSIRDLNTLIDPLDGQEDLLQKRLRACHNQSLLDDPVRVIRGIRLVRQFGLAYGNGLEKLMFEAANQLPEVSIERLRDEFFRILQGSDPVNGLIDCKRLNVLESLLPHLGDSHEVDISYANDIVNIPAIDSFYHLLRLFSSSTENSFKKTEQLVVIATVLDSYKDQINDYFINELTLGRSIFGLSVIGSMIYKLSSDDSEVISNQYVDSFGKYLRLSNTEVSWLKNLLAGLNGFQTLIKNKHPLTRHDFYKFYNISSDAGVAVAFLKIAEALAMPNDEIKIETYMEFLESVKSVLKAWWDQYGQVVKPDLLLNGDELQQIFNLSPGKEIGRLLSSLEEAQASGIVSTREDAVRLLNEEVTHMMGPGARP